MDVTTRLRTALLVLVMLVLAGPALAADRIRFQAGKSEGTIAGRITGYEVRDFVVGARAGQTMTVDMWTNNLQASFNLLPAGSQEAIFIGSISGNTFSGRLDRSGDYVISVAMMRAAARRNERADFRITVRITGGGAAAVTKPAPDFADGLAGGPDFWRVEGVARGDLLNIRRSPAADAPIVASVPNGTSLQNGGCRMVGSARWCMVDVPGGSGISGWASGRFLRE